MVDAQTRLEPLCPRTHFLAIFYQEKTGPANVAEQECRSVMLSVSSEQRGRRRLGDIFVRNGG